MTERSQCMIRYRRSNLFSNTMRPLSYFSATWTKRLIWMIVLSSFRSASSGSIPDLPEQLYFKTVGLPIMRVTEYRLGKGGMMTRVTHLRDLSEESTRKVTPSAWDRFQERVAGLRVAQWKREYVNPKQIMDGLTWTLQFRENSVTNISTGHQIGPDARDPSKSVDFEYPACGAAILMKALDELFAAIDPLGGGT